MKNRKRWLAACLAVLMLLTLLTGCKQPPVNVESGAAEQDYPVEVLGIEISSRPEKVVVLSASLADVALALGYEEQVVGVTADCTQPYYAETPKVDTNALESLTALEPDVVLAEADTPEATRTLLQENGLKVAYVAAPTDRADFERMYSEVGTVFAGASTGYTNGAKVALDICQTLDDIERIIPDTNGVVTTAAILFDLEGHGVVGGMFLDSVMDSAGLDNVFAGQRDKYDPAMLRALNPDFIFCTQNVADQLKSSYAGLNAVVNGHVVVISEAECTRMGRTVIALATTMAGSAYPELLEYHSQDPTTSVGQVSYEPLEPGEENDEVYMMQRKLYSLGYLTVSTYDGYYGAATQEAVKGFQENNGLEVTGLADEETLRVLYSSAAKGIKD